MPEIDGTGCSGRSVPLVAVGDERCQVPGLDGCPRHRKLLQPNNGLPSMRLTSMETKRLPTVRTINSPMRR